MILKNVKKYVSIVSRGRNMVLKLNLRNVIRLKDIKLDKNIRSLRLECKNIDWWKTI